MSNVSNFYEATTKKFDVTIMYNGSAPDITGDVVKFIVKEDKDNVDGDAIIDVDANVVNNGATGVAEFALSISETGVTPKKYYYDIIWTWSTGEVYVLESDSVTVLERVKDI